MRIARALIAAIALLGLVINRAHAEDYVTVRRSSPAGTVLRDAIAGGLAGTAVSGGVILYNMGIQDKTDYRWQRALALGAVIGLGAGAIFGIVDATSRPSHAIDAPREPIRDGRPVAVDVSARDQSGTQLFGIYARRF